MTGASASGTGRRRGRGVWLDLEPRPPGVNRFRPRGLRPIQQASAATGHPNSKMMVSPSPDPETLFDGAPSGSTPSLAYPLRDSMHPINMLSITPQWLRPKTSHAVTRIESKAKKFGHSISPVGPPTFPIQGEQDNTAPLSFRRALGGALAHNFRDQEVAIRVTSTDGQGDISPESEPLGISFTPAVVLGGLYYWTNQLRAAPDSGHEGMIMRAPLALRKPPLVRPNSPENGEECGGCHSVSRNGEVIALTIPIREPGSPPSTPATRRTWSHSPRMVALYDAVAVTLAPQSAINLDEETQTYNTWSVREGAIAIIPFDGEQLGWRRSSFLPSRTVCMFSPASVPTRNGSALSRLNRVDPTETTPRTRTLASAS